MPNLMANSLGDASETQQLYCRNLKSNQTEEKESHTPSCFSIKVQMSQAEKKGATLVPLGHPDNLIIFKI